MTQSTSNSNSPGFLGLLQLMFIGLKLTGYINWPWVWVLVPTWMSIFVALLLVGVLLVLNGIKND